jgi:hypothetical protein
MASPVVLTNAAIYSRVTTDGPLAALVAAWHRGKVPETAKWLAPDGHTLLIRGVYRFYLSTSIRRVRRTRIGAALTYQLKLYQRADSVTGLDAAATRLATLFDGVRLPTASGTILKCVLTADLDGTDTVAGVDYSYLGYELRLWALPTT